MNLSATLRFPLFAALGVAALPAGAVSLDLDDLPTGMDNSPGSMVPLANRLSKQFVSQNVLVSSAGGYAAVVLDGGSGVAWERNVPGVRHGLGGSTASNTLSYGQPISFTFVSTDGLTPYVTSAFSLYTDWYGVGDTVSITAYDLAGNVVARDSHAEQNGQTAIGSLYSLAGTNIHSVVFQGAGTQAISNIGFAQPVPIAATPEPSCLAAVGLGTLAWLRRRRKTSA